MPNTVFKISWKSPAGYNGDANLDDFNAAVKLLQVFFDMKYENICMDIEIENN